MADEENKKEAGKKISHREKIDAIYMKRESMLLRQ
jgi:hypothetical protein